MEIHTKTFISLSELFKMLLDKTPADNDKYFSLKITNVPKSAVYPDAAGSGFIIFLDSDALNVENIDLEFEVAEQCKTS